MSKADELEVKSFLLHAVKGVFDMMLSRNPALSDEEYASPNGTERVRGSVGFAGDISGIFCMQMEKGFAEELTCDLLDMEPDEIESFEDVSDAIGEICNMIGGNLKSQLCDNGFPCILSIPSITHGTHFKVSGMRGARYEHLVFQSGEYKWLIEVFLKAPT